MSFVQLDATWKFVAIVFAVTLYASIISFDMLSHWDTKKREDTRLLIVGVGVLAIFFYAITSPNVPTFVLNVLFIGLFVLAGLLASKENFDTSKKPAELYFVLIGSLTILVFSIVWWYFYTDAGKYVREKGRQAREYGREKKDQFSDWKERRRIERNERTIERGKALEKNMSDRRKMAGQIDNPMFDPSAP